jgi:predicted esterase
VGCKNSFSAEDVDDTLGQITTIRFSVDVSVPDNLEKAKDWGVLILPASYSNNKNPVRLVVYCHGGGANVGQFGSDIEGDNFIRYFVSQGLAVLGMAGMPEEYAEVIEIDNKRNMGSPIGIEAYYEGYRYVIENYNINQSGCFLFGFSHGGLISSNIVNFTNIPVVAQVGLAPLLSIEHNAWTLIPPNDNRYQYKLNIIRLFNMAPINSPEEVIGAIYEKEKVGIYDPYDYLINQAEIPYKIPYMIIASMEDELIYYWTIDSFVQTLNSKGSNILVLDAGEIGVHNVPASPVYVGEFLYNGESIRLQKTIYDVYEFYTSFLNNGN